MAASRPLSDPFMAGPRQPVYDTDISSAGTPGGTAAAAAASTAPNGSRGTAPLLSRTSGRTGQTTSSGNASKYGPWYLRTTWIILFVVILLVALALGVGLGVGLTRNHSNSLHPAGAQVARHGKSSDLAFTKGDIITIIEESSADWWLGSLNGRQGIFPSNLRFPPVSPIVLKLTRRNTSYQAPAPYQQPSYQQQQPAYQPYQQQQPQYSPAPYSAPTYDQKVETYHPPAPPQQPDVAPAPAAGPSGGPPPIPPKKKFGGKLGGMMATSFAGGLGSERGRRSR
ncbi:hypothetical protein RQP46_010123 [Phenoliferia psychrophenolica]